MPEVMHLSSELRNGDTAIFDEGECWKDTRTGEAGWTISVPFVCPFATNLCLPEDGSARLVSSAAAALSN